MKPSERYRARAARVLRIAEATSDDAGRGRLAMLAQSWLDMAVSAEESERQVPGAGKEIASAPDPRPGYADDDR